MTSVKGECSYRRAASGRRFNECGVLNNPPARGQLYRPLITAIEGQANSTFSGGFAGIWADYAEFIAEIWGFRSGNADNSGGCHRQNSLTPTASAKLPPAWSMEYSNGLRPPARSSHSSPFQLNLSRF
jgi:hypothetical protein